MAGSDQNDITNSVRDEARAAQKECAQEDLTQFRIGLNETAQRRAVHLQHLASFASAPAHYTAASGEDVNFTRKLARAVHHDGRLAANRGTHDLDASRDYDEQAAIRVTLVEEYFACCRSPGVAVRRQARDLRCVQRGEHRVALRGETQTSFCFRRGNSRTRLPVA